MTGPDRPPGRRLERERGAAGVEMAIMASAFLLATFLAVGGLRISGTQGDVSAAARAAARASAQEYGPAEGQAAAQRVAADSLASLGVACAQLVVTTGGEHRPGGIVTVTVSCEVDLSDVALVGFPGRVEARSTAAELVDVVRGGGS